VARNKKNILYDSAGRQAKFGMLDTTKQTAGSQARTKRVSATLKKSGLFSGIKLQTALMLYFWQVKQDTHSA